MTRWKCSFVIIILLSLSSFIRGSLKKRFFANTNSFVLNFVVN